MLTFTEYATIPVVPESRAPGTPSPPPTSADKATPQGEKPQVLTEVVIEEVSIDGMCGVY